MNRIKSIFRRKQKQKPQSLRVSGVGDTPLTQEPDDAEVAAQALLESMAEKGRVRQEAKEEKPEEGTADYYRLMADKIRQAHDAATLRTLRFVAVCEQELQKTDLPKTGPGSLQLLEAELMKRIDTIDREGGELKRRWQHCLAEVTVRLMEDWPGMSVEETGETTPTQ